MDRQQQVHHASFVAIVRSVHSGGMKFYESQNHIETEKKIKIITIQVFKCQYSTLPEMAERRKTEMFC